VVALHDHAQHPDVEGKEPGQLVRDTRPVRNVLGVDRGASAIKRILTRQRIGNLFPSPLVRGGWSSG
jgi:hypothetical protein